MTDKPINDRFRRRLLMESDDLNHGYEGEWDFYDLLTVDIGAGDAARLLDLETEDSENPIAAIAIVRPALNLVLDEAAVISKFAQEDA